MRRLVLLLAIAALGCEGTTRLRVDAIEIDTTGQVVLVDQVNGAPGSGESDWTEIRVLPGALSNVRVTRVDLPTGGSAVSMEAVVSEPKVTLWQNIATHVATFLGGLVAGGGI